MQQRLAEAGLPPLEQDEEPVPGFRLVRRRGRGGFGEVWEAEASGGIHVALKFVPLSPRARASELRALECVRDIRHPNILANFGSWQVGDTLIIGMELADGSLWDRYIRAGDEGLMGIPRAELLGYMADAAAGVDYLNESRHTVEGRGGVGVQHRDIKPPNILRFGGGVKVADLGMALAMDGEDARHTGVWTFPYAAPEFFRGRTTRQSDQYGLAATYCQLRCGRLPFEGNAATVTAGHLYGQPDFEDLPEAERPILERALAKEPGDRWPDCRSFVEALRAVDPAGAPEVLRRPTEPVEDIPRKFHSSTGSSGSPPITPDDLGDAPAPSWSLFDSNDDLRSPIDTTEIPAPSIAQSGVTAILPSAEPEPEPEPDATPVERSRPGRIGRYAASFVAIGLAIMAAGVLPSSDRNQGRRTPPSPAKLNVTGSVDVADPGIRDPETAAEVEATPSPPVGSRPGPEVEPLPAKADDLRPSSTPPAKPGPSAEAPTGRPDPILELPIQLDPIPAASAPLAPELLPPPPIELPGPAGKASPPRPGGVKDVEARPTSGSEQARPTGPPIAGDSAPVATNLVATRTVARPEPTPEKASLDPAKAAAAAEVRGRVHLSKAAFERAIAEFDQAIRLRPGHAPSYLYRALARHGASHYPESLADYSEAIRLRPGDPYAFIARGQAHHDLGAYGRAVADYSEAIRLRPADPSARFRRGLALYRSDDYAGALADFDETIRLDPKNARAREFRDDALARLGGRTRDTPRQAPAPEAAPKSPAPTPAGPSPRPPVLQPGGIGTSQPRQIASPPILIRVMRKVR